MSAYRLTWTVGRAMTIRGSEDRLFR
jgi:hypothetical protein